MSDCCGASEKKESKWGVKDCRARKCPDLQRDPEYSDSPQTCAVIHGMPGAMPMCVKEMDDEQFIRRISARLNTSEFNSPSPGVKNCPDACPYKLVSEGESEKGRKVKKGVCALTGWTLGTFAVCPCNVLGNPRQDDQIKRLRTLVEMRLEHCRDDNPVLGMCAMGVCPDGKDRDEWIDGNTELCPIIRMKKKELYGGRGCPLWKIPSKLLKAAAAAPVQESTENVEKPSQPESDHTADPCRHHGTKGCKIYSGTQDGVDTGKCDGRNPENWCYVEPTMRAVKEKRDQLKKEAEEAPAPEKRKRKEKTDHVCDTCRERMKGNVPDHACAWCKEEQENLGRRAWVTDIKLGSVLLGDMNEIGQRVPSESVDVIFTDPPYIDALYQQAYAGLGELARRVLKPYGYLFTYAPQAHLEEIFELVLRSGNVKDGELRYFWIIQSLNSGPALKAHKWNALCLHKPILVFQKVPEGKEIKGSRRCFADVVRGFKQKRFHPWQQSVHDVLGIIDRFMVPGEILLDPFAGWGTSLIAANLLGMQWLGMEIAPDRQEIARQRLQQKPMDLFTFGGEEPEIPPAREVPEEKDPSRQSSIDAPVKAPTGPPQERPQACRECEGAHLCKKHDPHAGCHVEVNEEITRKSGGPTPGTCGTCGHHKGRKTFEPTCPRLGELLFKGGSKSAKVLMQETERDRCKHWIAKISVMPEKTRHGPDDCFGKNCDQLPLCQECCELEECREAWKKSERKKNARCCCGTPEKKKLEPEEPNCGGKRPSLRSCPDNCPDRMIVPEDHGREKNYPQGRCKQTGEKLREMVACPNDPPKKSASKKSKTPKKEEPES